MKPESVGKQIGILRTRENIARKKLSSGLCSEPFLCMIEEEGGKADILTLSALLERLGKSSGWMTYILTAEEYHSVVLCSQMGEALRFGRLADARKVFRKYQKQKVAGKNKMLCMYEAKIRGILALEEYLQADGVQDGKLKQGAGRRAAGLGTAAKYFTEAIQQTLPFSDLLNGKLIRQLEKGKKLLAMTEVENILLYLYVQQLSGTDQGHTELLLALYHYIGEHMERHELRAQYFAKIGMLLGWQYLKKKDYRACVEIHEEILQSNRECGTIVCVLPVLAQIITAYQRLQDRGKVEFYTAHKENLEAIFSENRVPAECIGKLYYTFQPCQYFVEGELIAAERKWKGMSQEQLIAGIYENVENLSRIEHGRANADRKKFCQIMEHLGIDKTRYNGNLVTDEYRILELEKDIEEHLARQQFREASHELYMLKKSVDMEEKCNQQMVLGMKNREEYRNKEIGLDEALAKAKELLELTYHLDHVVNKKNRYDRIPFRSEAYLFNQICLFLRNDGRIAEAIRMMEKMMRTYEKEEDKKFHFKDVSLCATNLCKYLEIVDRLEEAEKIADMIIRESLACGEISLVHRLLATKFDIAEKREQVLEFGRGWLRQAYFLSEWNDRPKDYEKLGKALKEKVK